MSISEKRRRRIVRILVSLCALGVLLYGLGTLISKDYIRKAVFRYEIRDLKASLTSRGVGVLFLSVSEQGDDPSSAVMRRLRNAGLPVKRVSQCTTGLGGVKDKTTGENGMIVRVTSIRRRGIFQAEVKGGWYWYGLAARGYTYRVVWVGTWIVVDRKLNWLS